MEQFACRSSRRVYLIAVCCIAILDGDDVKGAGPFLRLGPASNIAVSQPLVSIEVVDDGSSLGPSTSNRFVLDTGANGIIAASEAYHELRSSGYRVEGTMLDQGVGGFEEFDISATYELRYTDGAGKTRSIPDARLMSRDDLSFCQLGLCPFYGIAGMPVMSGKVATLDLTTGSLLDALGLGEGIVTEFTTKAPPTSNARFRVPLTTVEFQPLGDGPHPTWENIPFLSVDPVHRGIRQVGSFVLDTGAQLSMISSDLAFRLGLDANGNGSLEDEAVGSVPIGGVGGQIEVPQLEVDELRIPTSEGIDLVVTDLQFGVLDIHPSIDGIFWHELAKKVTSNWEEYLAEAQAETISKRLI